MGYHAKTSHSQLVSLLTNAQAGDVLSLQKHDVTECNFSEADLRQQLERICQNNSALSSSTEIIVVDFSQANLHGRHLDNLCLTGFIFSGANCRHAVFTSSDLSDVKLDDAALDNADFRYCNMGYAKLYGSTIVGANFAGANLLTTYGLCFNMPDAAKKIVSRLKVASSINRTNLPKVAEKLRKKIEAA